MDSITLLDGFNNTAGWIQQRGRMDSITQMNVFVNAI